MSSRQYSVLMGDIVKSRSIQSQKLVHSKFNKLVNEANSQFKQELISPLTITLGDEFQSIIKNPVSAFRIARALRLESLSREFPIRFVIGVVTIDSPINKKNSWNMLGEGLAESRELLNKKEDFSAYRFYLGKDRESEKIQLLLDTLAFSMTEIEHSWTSSQRKYIIAALNEASLTKTDLAKKLGITRVGLYKNLKSAQFELYHRIIEAIEKALGDVI